MGLSKAINLFELCLWFMANFRENLSKLVTLVETLQTSVNEDWRGAKNNVNAFANWLIHSVSWFLIGWNGFSHVWGKSIRDCDWMKKFPYEFFMRSILSENLSKYEIKKDVTHSRLVLRGTIFVLLYILQWWVWILWKMSEVKRTSLSHNKVNESRRRWPQCHFQRLC